MRDRESWRETYSFETLEELVMWSKGRYNMEGNVMWSKCPITMVPDERLLRRFYELVRWWMTDRRKVGEVVKV